MKNPMENTAPAFEERERQDQEKVLLAKSISLNGLGDLAPKFAMPGSYNENQGVIVFSLDGQNFYATKPSEDTRALINDLGFHKNEGVGVPALNDRNTWTGKPSGLADWEKLQ
jgi:hypothetical protein